MNPADFCQKYKDGNCKYHFDSNGKPPIHGNWGKCYRLDISEEGTSGADKFQVELARWDDDTSPDKPGLVQRTLKAQYRCMENETKQSWESSGYFGHSMVVHGNSLVIGAPSASTK